MNQNTNDRDTADSAAKPPLADEARVLQRLMVGAGTSLPTAVLAALADLPTTTARRHLEHLVRTGSALRTGDEYAPVPGRQIPNPITPDLAAWARVADWYLASAYRAADILGSAALPADETIPESFGRPPLALRDAAEAVAWYQTTHTRLHAILDRAAAAGDHGRGWRLALLTLNIAAVAGPVGDWETLTDLGLNAARTDQADRATAMIMEYQGKLLVHVGRFEDAEAVHRAGLALREEAGDRVGTARSTNALGLIALREGNAEAAAGYFTQALALAAQAGSAEFAAYARLNLGSALTEQGRAAEARDHLDQASTYLRDAGRRNYLADSLHRLAATYRAEGDYAQALELATAAVHQATCAGLPMYLAGPLSELAEIHLALGDGTQALAALAEARAIYAELGDVVRAVRMEARIDVVGTAA
jgi:tetratricopeptide (TPR) repeat protein